MGLLCSSAAANHGAKCQGPSPSLLGVCFISPPLAISLVENRAPVSLDPTRLGSGAAFSLSAVIWGWERAGTAQLCVCVCVCVGVGQVEDALSRRKLAGGSAGLLSLSSPLWHQLTCAVTSCREMASASPELLREMPVERAHSGSCAWRGCFLLS